MNKILAFADEFGNNSFQFDTQGNYFIIASVIMKSENLAKNEKILEEIRKINFQTGEIKSSKVSSNYKRRIKILKSIQNVDFAIYAVAVDKQKLTSEGFKYKKSFYKFLNGILYKELYKTYPKLELIVDEHGGNDFMASFKRYVQKNHIRDLFSGSEFNVAKSQNDLGVQLADFIAGTLGFIFDDLKKSEHSETFLELLKPKLTSINHFPKKYEPTELKQDHYSNEYDKTIADLSLRKIFDYLDTNKGNDENARDRIKFLKLLLLFHQSNHHKTHTTAEEFLEHLNVNRSKMMKKEFFARNIIANLRDNGILIASNRDGYKLPTSVKDLKDYINHGNKIIFALIRRIEECRNSLLLATTNDFDILKENEFRDLKELIDRNAR